MGFKGSEDASGDRKVAGVPDPAHFPSDFLWGTATASFQVEGAASEDGRGESIWDRFCRTPGKVAGGHTGDVACDHYHRYPEDIRLMKELGAKAYRFSIAWPRVVPAGRGPVNPAGLDFYDRLTDALLKAGIEPYVTLYHWDLPQALQDEGGWLSRGTVDAFAAYAEAVIRRLGDRVGNWMTMNEIPCFIGKSYDEGKHAPGLHVSRRQLNQAYHHAFLGHGRAVRLVREHARKGAEVGLVNNPYITVPLIEDAEGARAAAAAFDRRNAYLLDPILRGAYASWWLEEQGPDAPEVAAGDLEVISSPCDFHGLNVYSAYFTEPSAGPEGFAIVPFPTGYPRLNLDWLKPVPQSIYWASRYMAEGYGVEKLYISESGCSCDDAKGADGRIMDLDRVQWLRDHFRQARRAVSEGLPLRGYFVWSLLDNFEWSEGYLKRFGIHYVDYETQERIPKASARYAREVFRTGRY
jgi:beta-glucosidase